MTQEELLCRGAVAKWGPLAQMGMAMEECAELIVAINQLQRDRADSRDLAEEIADVEIMCRQLRMIIGGDLVDAAKERKLRRLANRLRDS